MPHGAVDDATAEEQALTDRDAGALLLRDAGSPADTRWIDEREDLPRIIRAGRHIARTRRYIRNYAHEIEPERPGRVRAARGPARRRLGQARRRLDRPRRRRPRALLARRRPWREAVAEAHEEGARVTAHCFAEESLRDLVEAGIDCVEHATGLHEDTIPLFAAQGVAIVPTLVNIATFPPSPPAAEKFPDCPGHMRDLHERRYDTVAAAYDAGIPVYVGTDAGGSLPHGLVATEVAELARAGLPPPRRSTRPAGVPAPGSAGPGLEEGAEADLVVYPQDPLEDLAALATPSRVVLRGRTVA